MLRFESTTGRPESGGGYLRMPWSRFGGEGVSQSPLKHKAFSTLLGQNLPFELRRKMGFRLQQSRVSGTPSLSMQTAKVCLSDCCSCSACQYQANARGGSPSGYLGSWPASEFILMGRAHVTKPWNRGSVFLSAGSLAHSMTISWSAETAVHTRSTHARVSTRASENPTEPLV